MLEGPIGEHLRALRGVEVRDLVIARPPDERVPRVQPEEHARGPTRDLRVHPDAAVASLLAGREDLAPHLGRVVDLRADEGERTSRALGQTDDPIDLVHGRLDLLADGAEGHDLIDTGVRIAQGVAEREQLTLVGVRARYDLAVLRAVGQGARGGEAERPGFDGFAHERGHALDVVVGRILVVGASLTHHVGPQCRVGDLRRDVDRPLTSVERVEVLREGLPAPRHALAERSAGDVLHGLHELDEPGLLARCDGSEPDTAVAHDKCGHAVVRRWLEKPVPGGLAVVVGVHIDEARRDEKANGVDSLARGALDVATDGDDDTVADREVASERRRPRAIDERASADQEIELLGHRAPSVTRRLSQGTRAATGVSRRTHLRISWRRPPDSRICVRATWPGITPPIAGTPHAVTRKP
ncbi:unannotated protein [freshwater metagenome]|uniref:Unannotated protein n=1 Tax=freshwater metagenome TaxID=449393 RepID=A0A6J7ATT8_9ZZZZ